MLENAEDSELHEQQRDRHVEDEPDDAAGMAVGHPREEVRPRDRARIGVGDVDLELRDDDERAGEGERDGRRRKHRLERDEVHLGRFGGLVDRHEMTDRDISEERARQQLEHPRHDPAGAGGEKCRPPCGRPSRIARRQKAQKVDLLPDLRDQREHHGRRGAEHQEVERSAVGTGTAAIVHPSLERFCIGERDEHERQDVKDDPDGLGPQLKSADEGDAVRDQGNHHDRADDVAEEQGNAEPQLQREREDRRLDGEEQEREGGVDQRGDGRADVAEACAAGQEIDIDPVGGGVIGDRQPGEEDHATDGEDGDHRIGHPVIDRDRAADRLEREKRNRADGGVGDPQARPPARALRGEAQRIVFEGLVGDPSVVVAPYPNDALVSSHAAAAPVHCARLVGSSVGRCGPGRLTPSRPAVGCCVARSSLAALP